MKKIFAVYLSVLCAFPILVSGNVPCSTYNNNRANCLAKGGCWFDSFVSPTVCDACYNDQYNPQQQNCNDEDNDNCENSCQSVPFGSYKNDAGTGYLACPTNNIISAGDTDVMYIGNCSCTANTQLIKTSPNSVDQYYCGLCGVGISGTTSTNNITQFNCASVYGANNVHGSKVEYSNIRVECACPEGATLQNGACVCTDPNKSLTLDSTTNTYVCRSCIDPHATNNGGTCKCTVGYYGVPAGLATSCTKCPTGMTTITNNNGNGATDVSECYMTNQTEFCMSSQPDLSCLRFIPSGIKINADGVTSVNNIMSTN